MFEVQNVSSLLLTLETFMKLHIFTNKNRYVGRIIFAVLKANSFSYKYNMYLLNYPI